MMWLPVSGSLHSAARASRKTNSTSRWWTLCCIEKFWAISPLIWPIAESSPLRKSKSSAPITRPRHSRCGHGRRGAVARRRQPEHAGERRLQLFDETTRHVGERLAGLAWKVLGGSAHVRGRTVETRPQLVGSALGGGDRLGGAGPGRFVGGELLGQRFVRLGEGGVTRHGGLEAIPKRFLLSAGLHMADDIGDQLALGTGQRVELLDKGSHRRVLAQRLGGLDHAVRRELGFDDHRFRALDRVDQRRSRAVIAIQIF